MTDQESQKGHEGHESTALLHAFLQAVSFPAGGRPDYPRIGGLFRPDGRLIKCSGPEPESLTVPEFITDRQRIWDAGHLTWFREDEPHGHTDVFGRVAQRRSAYTKAGRLDGVDFAATGVIFTQFTHSATAGWQIASMIWDDEPR
jgi:hypothetical protein